MFIRSKDEVVGNGCIGITKRPMNERNEPTYE